MIDYEDTIYEAHADAIKELYKTLLSGLITLGNEDELVERFVLGARKAYQAATLALKILRERRLYYKETE